MIGVLGFAEMAIRIPPTFVVLFEKEILAIAKLTSNNTDIIIVIFFILPPEIYFPFNISSLYKLMQYKAEGFPRYLYCLSKLLRRLLLHLRHQ